ncbi:MAG: hypothetical protein M1830_008435 [Pleopsidium flavum]|nr:MAG: hypothetical protein M1830_008435 [Pleopsidium flavum]
MVQYIPPPDSRTLLPPLLACLPTAFASPRPPPALLPLLSPILRQRVQLLSTSTPSTESWLPLLCWHTTNSEKLASIVESDAFELHPVSGEIEFKDVEQARYRRLDPETLHAEVVPTDLSLVITYLWCVDDEEGGGTGWRVAELSPADLAKDDQQMWWSSIGKAEDMARENTIAVALREAERSESGIVEASEEDDDDYWAQYDSTPGRTPANIRSPEQKNPADVNGHPRTTSEAEYFAQYAEVQPALDSDDSSKQHEEFGKSSLNGNVITTAANRQISSNNAILPASSESSPRCGDFGSQISQPRPSSSSDGSVAVARLEHSAASLAQSERAARQHISSTIKNLFRLARNTGIERLEFERMVRTELETLSMIDGDD